MSEVSEYDWSKGIGIGITDPWWRVELALSSVLNVTLTLPGSAATSPLSYSVYRICPDLPPLRAFNFKCPAVGSGDTSTL
jgi:hypothetical protein